MLIKCATCKGYYLCEVDNTRIYGSRIETRCPRCRTLLDKNVSAFTEEQMFLVGFIGRFPRAAEMISLAQLLARKVNSDEPYSVKKKNVRDELPDI